MTILIYQIREILTFNNNNISDVTCINGTTALDKNIFFFVGKFTYFNIIYTHHLHLIQW